MNSFSQYLQIHLLSQWIEQSNDTFEVSFPASLKLIFFEQYLKENPSDGRLVDDFFLIIQQIDFSLLFDHAFLAVERFSRAYRGPLKSTLMYFTKLKYSSEKRTFDNNFIKLSTDIFNAVSKVSKTSDKNRLGFIKNVIYDLIFVMDKAWENFVEVHPLEYPNLITPSRDEGIHHGIEYSQKTVLIDGKQFTGISIDKLNIKQSILIIPSTIDNLPVIEIAKNAFVNHVEIIVAILPQYLKKVGENAFGNLTNLKEIYLTSMFEFDKEGVFFGSGKFTLYFPSKESNYSRDFRDKQYALSKETTTNLKTYYFSDVLTKEKDGNYYNARGYDSETSIFYTYPKKGTWSSLHEPTFIPMFFVYVPITLFLFHFWLQWSWFAQALGWFYLAGWIVIALFTWLKNQFNPVKWSKQQIGELFIKPALITLGIVIISLLTILLSQ